MGYYTNLIDSKIFVKKEDFPKVYEKMCELNNYDELKRGGSFGKTDDQPSKWNPNKWFSWMDYNYPDTLNTMEEILQQVGFELTFDKEGNLTGLGYYNKTGNEDYFLSCFAAYVENDSYVKFKGEEDFDWYRFVFNNGKMTKQVGDVTVKWEDQHTYEFGKMSADDEQMAKWFAEFNEKQKAEEIGNG